MTSGLMKTCGCLRLVLLGEVHGDDALRHADLDGSKPDAGRGVHGLEHVVDQRAQRLVDGLHRLGFQPQPFVGNDEDVAHGHGRRCKGKGQRGQCGLSPLSHRHNRPTVRPSFACRGESR